MQKHRKLISIVGARPQFVKLAALHEPLRQRFHHVIVHTGQHYDTNMSGVFFKSLGIPKATVNLGIGGGSHGAMTGRMLGAIERVIAQQKPDLILVYGDTNSTLAGALAASKMGVSVAHIEAGMRSFVKQMPEEINRRLTDHISDLLLCSTAAAVKNCRSEKVMGEVVHCGDLMYELLHSHRDQIKNNRAVLTRHDLKPGEYLLATVHRAANTDSQENLSAIVDILCEAQWPVLFPVHPRTRKMLRVHGLYRRLSRAENVTVTEPMSYHDTLAATAHARAVLTDSGGLQKEAIFLRTPVLTLRRETEWVELVGRGNHLVGLDGGRVRRLLKRKLRVTPPAYRIGRRKPSEIIVAAITRFLF
ncbi:MAG: UDP-N-acetylglucosamine 2-epimerase (non-hydrolyzing) [bacterium]